MAKLVPKIYPNDYNENVPVGIGFPLVIGSPNQNFTTSKQIHDNLRNLILTMKGERVHHPTYGSDLFFLLFEPLNKEDLTQSAKETIKASVNQWMPFVNIQMVTVTEDEVNSRITVEVDYDVDGWPTPEILNLTVEK